MAVITATPNFVSTEMVLAAAALLSTFLLLVISLKSFLAYCFRSNKKVEQIHNGKMMAPSAGNTKPTGSNPSFNSLISCCIRNNKENVKADKVVMILAPPSASSNEPTTSNRSLSSTIQSKDFFHNIEMAAFSPFRKSIERPASLSDVSAPGISYDHFNIYQNVPANNEFSSALPNRPQTAVPVTESIFTFTNTTSGPQCNDIRSVYIKYSQ